MCPWRSMQVRCPPSASRRGSCDSERSPDGALMVVASQKVCPYALLRSLESLLQLLESMLQLLKVSLNALDVPLIPEASQAFTLQLLREALEFSLKLQVRVLPHELFDPPLRLQPFPTLVIELV